MCPNRILASIYKNTTTKKKKNEKFTTIVCDLLLFFVCLLARSVACQNWILPPTISCSSSSSLSTYLSVIFLERSAALPISFSFLSSTRPILRLVCVKLARQERSYDDVYRVLLLDSDELSATHGWFDSHTELGGVRGANLIVTGRRGGIHNR